MKLVVMRHAKSSWKEDSLSDRDRPLKKRGQRDAPVIARRLAELVAVPTTVISSDSTRTRETLELMLPEWEQPPVVHFDPQLYLGDRDAIVAAVDANPPTGDCLLVLGHNPGWEELASDLAGEYRRLRTCNAPIFTREDSLGWSEALRTNSGWTLEEWVSPSR